MNNSLPWSRTHSCGELSSNDENREVVLAGWVHNWRDHGGVIFIDLRDRAGITQLIFNPSANAGLAKKASRLRHEFVIAIRGRVQRRPDEMVNPKMVTGGIEIAVDALEILNDSQTPPLHINSPEKTESEELRLKYRYLDLRRPFLKKNIIFRHTLTMEVRKFLSSQGFYEIETPLLMKSTPEGARDFLVPSRLSKGRFYALPQSPQTYKQLLMVSGFERYFQLARCFRDEDLRADRQPEFTQIDAELSFVDEEEIYLLFEGLIKTVFQNCLGKEISTPFRRMSYREALYTYGTDKPDLRFDLPIKDVSSLFSDSSFKVFRTVLQKKGAIGAICGKSCGDFSRKKIDELTALVGRYGAAGLVWLRVKDGGLLEGPSAKFFTPQESESLIAETGAEQGDMIFIVAASGEVCFPSLGQLRLELGRIKDLMRKDEFSLLWVYGFPLFQFSEEENRYTSVHHPFTAPLGEDVELLDGADFHKARSRAYDLVLNGTEIGGGSIRIHNQSLQRKIFNLLEIGEREAEEKFGFLLHALSFGAPPHGGIALGLDRLIMLMLGLDSIRDVIPFPKTAAGISVMDNAPDTVSGRQLAELGIGLVGDEGGDG
ncbi:Aspartyl-tRNA synthetase [Chitinispirillum alkaliphilum]|nr:Aspartyl-tRNA synthetase [Chitinispirillum alkaliphilum]